MSSFLASVLVTAGKVEKLDLNEKISEIQRQISRLKSDVKGFMDDNYIEFVPKLKQDEALIIVVQKLVKEMNILQKRVHDQIKIELSGSTSELQALSNDLQKSSLSLSISSRLIELHSSLQSVENYKSDKRYVDAARTLQSMSELLQDSSTDAKYLDIFQALKDEYSSIYGTFLSDIMILWQRYINWEIVESTDVVNHSSVNLAVRCNVDEIRNLTKALYHMECLQRVLNKFSGMLLKHLVDPIINRKCSVYVTNETIFTVQPINRTEKPDYKSVLHNLRLLFRFLHQHFNMDIENDSTFLAELETHIFQEFSDNIINNCISRTIPCSSVELQNFGPIIEDISNFQNYLADVGFIKNDKIFLSDYIRNVDSLFIEKICEDFLKKARAIMKKDLHDSVAHEPDKESINSCERSAEHRTFEVKSKLYRSTFQLPPCQISKSVREVLDLARSVLDEACQSSDTCAVRLFYTSRNIFEMYSVIVPEHHKKFLETIPQQVALFHNNCIYLAHHLIVLSYEYENKLPEVLRKHNVTYTDQAVLLRSVGSRYFLGHMRYQRSIIADILKEPGLSMLGHESALPSSTERAMRQCVRQLELLRTVWHHVLPTDVYCRAVGCIMNSMIEELITRVIGVEDIPSDVARELATLFKMIISRTPLIFPEPKAVQLHVKRWGKLLELVNVLGASLKEIDDRWADGKGPLAHEFTATQVKQLVRALFQNTDRRSILLAGIK